MAVQSLCWIDNNTLIAGTDSYLIKYTIDTQEKVCRGEVLDEVTVNSLSCAMDGKVYVTPGWTGRGTVNVRIYDVNTGNYTVWDTDIYLVDSGGISPAVSSELIVISVHNASYVYNTDHVLLYQRTQLSWGFLDSYISDGGIYWGATYAEKSLLVVNLSSNNTIPIENGILSATGVTGIKGYVYVTNSTHVGVYSEGGTFMQYLQVAPIHRARYLDNEVSITAYGDLFARCGKEKGQHIRVSKVHSFANI